MFRPYILALLTLCCVPYCLKAAGEQATERDCDVALQYLTAIAQGDQEEAVELLPATLDLEVRQHAVARRAQLFEFKGGVEQISFHRVEQWVPEAYKCLFKATRSSGSPMTPDVSMRLEDGDWAIHLPSTGLPSHRMKIRGGLPTSPPGSGGR